MSSNLEAFGRQFQYNWFDPSNPEHLAAYRCLADGVPQRSNVRFHLEKPFASIVHMMEHKIAMYHCGIMLNQKAA